MKPSAQIKSLTDALCARFGGGDEGMVAVVDLAVLIAAADGTIDADERAALIASLEVVMGAATLAPAVVRYLVRESRNQIEAAGADARARAIGRLLAEHAAGDDGLRLGLAIAHASGGLSATEKAVLGIVAKAAGISTARFDALAASAASAAPSEAGAPSTDEP